MLLHSCLSPISAEDDPVYLSHYRVLHLEYANIVCSKEVIPFAVTVELEQFGTKRAWFHPPYECMIDSLTYDRSKVVFALKFVSDILVIVHSIMVSLCISNSRIDSFLLPGVLLSFSWVLQFSHLIDRFSTVRFSIESF